MLIFRHRKAQGSRNVEKIRIKNNSLCILCPEYAKATANTDGYANFSRTSGVLFPGDEGEFEFSYHPTAYGINNGNGLFRLNFLVISADTNFTGMSDFPSTDEIPMLKINFYSNRFGKLFIIDVTINGEVIKPAYAPGLDPMGNEHMMTYIRYTGTNNSMEPSFGMSFFDVRAATVNVRNATGTTSLVFTPSARRSSEPLKKLNNPGSNIVGELAVRNFLRVCLHKYRTQKPSAYAGMFAVLNGALAALSIYNSISTRTNSNSYLTVNIRNLTGNNMFMLRRKYSNSMRTDNGIIADGEIIAIPLSFTSFRPEKPEIFLRIVEGNKESTDLTIVITDYGDNLSLKVSRISLYGGKQEQHDPRPDSSPSGATNCIFNFISPNKKNVYLFSQPL